MRRLLAMVIPLGLLAALLVGCGRGQKPIPPGAQQVHVVVTSSDVRLDPATVRAGNVYLVLDPLEDGSYAFVQRQRAPDDVPGPLSDDDLARIAQGDSKGTSISAVSVGCTAEQRAEDRGQTGPCGNVYGPLVLKAGKYAFLGPGWIMQETEPSTDPTADPAGFSPPSSMAILVVLP